MKVILVAGARPNFMKIAPLWLEMKRFPSYFEPVMLHTGQHYDYEMSKVFFEDLNLPEPDYFLGVGSGTHGEQTERIMIEFEKVLQEGQQNLIDEGVERKNIHFVGNIMIDSLISILRRIDQPYENKVLGKFGLQ